MNIEIEKRRPTGVTVLAVLAIIGGLISLFFGFAFSVAPQMKPFMVMNLSFVCGIAVWGFANASGLWRLKNWARISTIIFQIMPSFMIVMVPIIIATMPYLGADVGKALPALIVIMIVIFAIPAAIGIWSILYLNKKEIVARFLIPGTKQALLTERRPFLISAIAGFCIYGGITTLLISFFQPYALVMGFTLHGIPAKVYSFAVGAIYLTSGLLMWRLRKQGLILAACYFIYSAVTLVLSASLPSARATMNQAFQTMQKASPQMPANVGAIFGHLMIIMAFVICVMNAIILAILYWKRGSFTDDKAAPTSSPET